MDIDIDRTIDMDIDRDKRDRDRYKCIYIYVYMYISRERERERCLYICVGILAGSGWVTPELPLPGGLQESHPFHRLVRCAWLLRCPKSPIWPNQGIYLKSYRDPSIVWVYSLVKLYWALRVVASVIVQALRA